MDKLKKLVLFGAGGMARELLLMIDAINSTWPTYNFMGFVVEDKFYKPDMEVNGFPVLGTEEWLIEHKQDVVCTCAVGYAKERARIQNKFSEFGVRFESLIHPLVYIPETTVIGEGTVIFFGTTVSCNMTIGRGVFINTYTILGHDTSIGDYTVVSPGCGIGGRCKIGDRVTIGGHSYIIPDRKIGNEAVIAAGSIVFTNVKAGTTVLGNPAKRMKSIE